jgi:hypothetical protein
MSNTNDATHPEWRQLCQAALFETNPVKLLKRIAHARNAVLDRIEDGQTAEWRTTRFAKCFKDAGQYARNYGASKWLSVKC